MSRENNVFAAKLRVRAWQHTKNVVGRKLSLLHRKVSFQGSDKREIRQRVTSLQLRFEFDKAVSRACEQHLRLRGIKAKRHRRLLGCRKACTSIPERESCCVRE